MIVFCSVVQTSDHPELLGTAETLGAGGGGPQGCQPPAPQPQHPAPAQPPAQAGRPRAADLPHVRLPPRPRGACPQCGREVRW